MGLAVPNRLDAAAAVVAAVAVFVAAAAVENLLVNRSISVNLLCDV